MSSTSASMTAARPATKPWLSGHALAIPGAVLAIVSFFLPWYRFADGVKALATLNGLQVASGAKLTSEGATIFSGSFLSFLAPIAGIVILVLVFLAYRRGHVTEVDGFAATSFGLLTLLILWLRFQSAQRAAADEGVSIQLQIGILGVYLALTLLFAAGLLYIRAVGVRKPSFRAVLGAWGFMAPVGVLVTVFFFIPVILLFALSLTDLSSKNFFDPWTFIGLGNYIRLFNDAFFPKILGNTLRLVVLTLGFFNVGLALVIALLTSHIRRRAGFLFRVIWLLPRITPPVIYILMWRRIAHQPPFGIINQLLGPLGLEQQYWLFESPWLFVILTGGFVGASFGMVIFTSAIESIPKDYITAAKVDGASTLQIIRDITLPMIRWPLLFVVTYQSLSLLTSFEYVLLLTDGGPGLFKTEVWALTAYHRALQTYFGNNQWGYGAAWGFILVIIGVVLAFAYQRLFRFNELVQEPKIDVL